MTVTYKKRSADLDDLLRIAKGDGHTEGTQITMPEVVDWTAVRREFPQASQAEIRNILEDRRQVASQNLLLYRNQYGRLVVSSHLTFPITFNTSADTSNARGKIEVVRPYWLGKGSTTIFANYAYKRIRTPNQLEDFISKTLVDQVVEMVLLYAHNVDLTPRSLLIQEKNTGITVERSFYCDRFDENFGSSKYTYNLVTSLAKFVKKGCPDNFDFVEIPEILDYHDWSGPVLSKSEYAKIIANLKTKNYKIPKQLESMFATNATKQISKTNEELLKEIAFLREKVAKTSNATDDFESLKQEYIELTGKPPVANIKLETLKKKITEIKEETN